jgi:hypothetical protein
VDFWDATKLMLRRWYIALPLLLLTAAATAYTAAAVKPDHVLTSYVQLIPSIANPDKAEGTETPRNPWNALGLEALSQAANYAVLDQTFLDQLSREGYSINFSIIVGTPPAGATIEVVGQTRQQAVRTTERIIQRYRETVQALQAQYGVKRSDMITMQRLDQGQNLKRPDGKVKRALLAVGGAGLLMAAGSTIAIDAFLRRRRRRRAELPGADERTVGRSADAGHNGSQKILTRDSDNETVRIDTGKYRSMVADSKAGVSQREATNGDGASPEVMSDATIVLPLSRDWIAGDKGGSRR